MKVYLIALSTLLIMGQYLIASQAHAIRYSLKNMSYIKGNIEVYEVFTLTRDGTIKATGKHMVWEYNLISKPVKAVNHHCMTEQATQLFRQFKAEYEEEERKRAEQVKALAKIAQSASKSEKRTLVIRKSEG